MVFGFFGYLFSNRRKVFKLRKKYDRAREKIDKIKDSARRTQLLRMLDQVEPTLVMLEEQKISRFERGRMRGYVEDGVARAKAAIKQPYTPAYVPVATGKRGKKGR